MSQELTLTIRVTDGIAAMAVIDTVNETLRALAQDDAIDDTNDEGWAWQ